MATAAAPTTATSPGIVGSSPSDSFIITSPSLSASSLSSSGFDFVAVRQRLEQGDARDGSRSESTGGGNARPHEGEPFSDDDEIVWSVSESEFDIEGTNVGPLSDDDFVVLSRARSPARSAGNAGGTGTGTVRGAVSRTGTAASKTSGGLSGSDGSVGVTLDFVKVATAMEKTALVSADLAAELAKLSMGVGHIGERHQSNASGARTPIRGKPAAEPGTTKKKLKVKKAKKEDEGKEKGQERKEKKKARKKEQEADSEKKGKKRKSKREDPKEATVTPVARESPLPPFSPALPAAPPLAKSISTATLVPSSTITTLDSTPLPADEIHDLAPTNLLAIPPSPPSSPGDSPKTPTAAPKPLKGKKKQKKDKATTTTFAAPVFVPADEEDNSPFQQPNDTVEKVSEHTQEPTAYDEAVSYITSYISNPTAHRDRVCHLTLLQSLIIELGLLADLGLLPRTIRSAKTFIKSHAFLNVKEYVAKRGQGLAVMRGLLFSSRSALVKSMKQKKNYASLGWVKKKGLQDLLVTVYRH